MNENVQPQPVKPRKAKQRRRGTGTVFRPKGALSLWIRYYRNGKPVYENTKTTNRTEAQKTLNDRLNAIGKGAKIDVAPTKLTFDDALKLYRTDIALNGCAERLGVEKNLVPFFAGTPLPSIDFAMISRYQVDRRKAGAANATINRELAVLRRAFVLVQEKHPFLTLPKIKNLKENNVRAGFFEHAQFESVCKHLSPAVRAVVEFAYYTGWRKAEILGLEWPCVDLREGTVSLNPGETKNDDARVIYMSDELRALLEGQDAERVKLKAKGKIVPWVFHRAGKPIKDYYTAWRTATKLAGCPGRILHDFRRTAARDLVRAGIPERVAMQLTGHKTRSMFDRYSIVAPADLKHAAKAMSRAAVANR